MTNPVCVCCNRTFRSPTKYQQYLLRRSIHEQLRIEVEEVRGERLTKRERRDVRSDQFRRTGEWSVM